MHRSDAQTDVRTADELVAGWCAALDDPQLADCCERLLEKWAQAVAEGKVVVESVDHILDQVIDEHLMTGPMAAFLIGKEGTAYNSSAVIAMRERLMVRRRRPVPSGDSEGGVA
jgi:hypothetical protein